LETPETLDEALAIIEEWKCCAHCKYFYDWTATMQMCMYPDGSPEDRASRCRTHWTTYGGVCDKFDVEDGN
jgi:hypothetical protein